MPPQQVAPSLQLQGAAGLASTSALTAKTTTSVTPHQHNNPILGILKTPSNPINGIGNNKTTNVPFNVNLNNAPPQHHDHKQQLQQHVVQRSNNKILYEDPLEKKRRERENRIQQERAEQASLQDHPFLRLGGGGGQAGRAGIGAIPTSNHNQNGSGLYQNYQSQSTQELPIASGGAGYQHQGGLQFSEYQKHGGAGSSPIHNRNNNINVNSQNRISLLKRKNRSGLSDEITGKIGRATTEPSNGNIQQPFDNNKNGGTGLILSAPFGTNQDNASFRQQKLHQHQQSLHKATTPEEATFGFDQRQYGGGQQQMAGGFQLQQKHHPHQSSGMILPPISVTNSYNNGSLPLPFARQYTSTQIANQNYHVTPPRGHSKSITIQPYANQRQISDNDFGSVQQQPSMRNPHPQTTKANAGGIENNNNSHSPGRSHLVSQMAGALSVQAGLDPSAQHQSQKVTNLESGNEMNDRYEKQRQQKLILEQQMAEKRAQKEREKQRELEADQKEEQRLKREQERVKQQEQRSDVQSPKAQQNGERSAIVVTGNNSGGGSDGGIGAPPPNKVLTQKEKNLLHARQRREQNDNNLDAERQGGEKSNNINGQPGYQRKDSHTTHIKSQRETIAAPLQFSSDPQKQQQLNLNRHEFITQRTSLENDPGSRLLSINDNNNTQRDNTAALLAAQSQQNQQQQVMQMIQNQLKEELQKFRTEMADQKDDFKKIIEQVKTDVLKNDEDQQKFRTQKSQKSNNNLQKITTAAHHRDPQAAAKNILNLYKLDEIKIKYMKNQSNNHRNLQQPNLISNPSNPSKVVGSTFQRVHEQLLQNKINRDSPSKQQQLQKKNDQNDQQILNQTTKSLAAETKFIGAKENPQKYLCQPTPQPNNNEQLNNFLRRQTTNITTTKPGDFDQYTAGNLLSHNNILIDQQSSSIHQQSSSLPQLPTVNTFSFNGNGNEFIGALGGETEFITQTSSNQIIQNAQQRKQFENQIKNLDGQSIFALKQLDNLNRNATNFLQKMKGKSRAISYQLTEQISEPAQLPNRDHYDIEWRNALCSNMPLYFNVDGSRTQQAIRSRSRSPLNAAQEAKVFQSLNTLNQYQQQPQQPQLNHQMSPQEHQLLQDAVAMGAAGIRFDTMSVMPMPSRNNTAEEALLGTAAVAAQRHPIGANNHTFNPNAQPQQLIRQQDQKQQQQHYQSPQRQPPTQPQTILDQVQNLINNSADKVQHRTSDLMQPQKQKQNHQFKQKDAIMPQSQQNGESQPQQLNEIEQRILEAQINNSNKQNQRRKEQLQQTINALQDFNNNLHINSPPMMSPQDKVIKSMAEKYPQQMLLEVGQPRLNQRIIHNPHLLQSDLQSNIDKRPSPMGYAESATILKRQSQINHQHQQVPQGPAAVGNNNNMTESHTSFGIQIKMIPKDERIFTNSSQHITEMSKSAKAFPEINEEIEGHQNDENNQKASAQIAKTSETVRVEMQDQQPAAPIIEEEIIQDKKDTVFLTQNIEEDFEDQDD